MTALAPSGLTLDQCATLARQGDQGAFERLLREFRPLIRSEAYRFASIPGHGIDDLEQIGKTCLWKLVQAFDGSRGNWCSLAKQGLRRCMLKALRDQTRRARWNGHAPLSLEALTRCEDQREPCTGVDIAGVVSDQLHAEQVARAALRLCPDRTDRRLLESIMHELPLSSLSREIGISSQALSHRRGKLLGRLRTQLGWLAP